MTRHVLKLYISVKFITANIVNRTTGDLIATASTVEHCIRNSFDCGRSSNPKAAAAVGEVLAKRFRIASFSGCGDAAARGIHVDVNHEIEKKGSEKSKMIWCVVNSLRNDGLKIVLDDESRSGPSVRWGVWISMCSLLIRDKGANKPKCYCEECPRLQEQIYKYVIIVINMLYMAQGTIHISIINSNLWHVQTQCMSHKQEYLSPYWNRGLKNGTLVWFFLLFPYLFFVTTHSLTRLTSRSPIIAPLVRWRTWYSQRESRRQALNLEDKM